MYGPGGRRAGSAKSASGRATALDRPRERAVIALRLGANTVELRVYKFNPLRRNAGFITRERAKRPQYGICALFLDSVTTQVSGVWVEFVLYSTLINLASRGRQRRLLGFCTSECIGSNH